MGTCRRGHRLSSPIDRRWDDATASRWMANRRRDAYVNPTRVTKGYMRHFVSVLVLVTGVASTSAAQRADSLTRAVDKVFDNFRGTDGPGCAVGVSRDG